MVSKTIKVSGIPVDLDLVRQCVNDTTPGNWVVHQDYPLQVLVDGYQEAEDGGVAICDEVSSRDARFIANSKAWILALLDEVEARRQ
jgi:hypothetical protein